MGTYTHYAVIYDLWQSKDNVKRIDISDKLSRLNISRNFIQVRNELYVYQNKAEENWFRLEGFNLPSGQTKKVSLTPVLQILINRAFVNYHNTHIVASGGTMNGQQYGSVEVYDIMKQLWIGAPSLTEHRDKHVGCELGSHVYIAGGQRKV